MDLGKIARSSRRFELDEATDDDLNYLEGKGTSLGGARPKCTVLDEHGNLAIGKFASVNDERSVVKGEILGLELARAAGLNAAVGQVVTVDGVNVAVVKRFDRTRLGRRIPYWSMATFCNVLTMAIRRRVISCLTKNCFCRPIVPISQQLRNFSGVCSLTS